MASFDHLSLFGALCVCFLFAILFVISLYLADIGLPRDHPLTIRRRMLAVGVVCAIIPLLLWLLSESEPGDQSLLAVMGVRWGLLEPILAVLVSTVLVLVLYVGPIMAAIWSNEGGASLLEPLENERRDVMLRNFVVAPLAEELVFRACMFPLLLPKLGSVWTAFVCPLFFGLAHLHHAVEHVRRGDITPSQALLTTLLQATYTSLFGMFSGILLIRTGYIISAIVAHALCNILGLPDIYSIADHRQPLRVAVMYVVGLVGFLYLLFPLTSSKMFSGY